MREAAKRNNGFRFSIEPGGLRFSHLILPLVLLFLPILYGLRGLLSESGQYLFQGDLEQWYGFFHAFYISLKNLSLPLWDPYTNFGTPLYPAVAMLRFFDPLDIGLTFFISRFPGTIFEHYRYFVLTKVFFYFLGIAFLNWTIFRRFCRTPSWTAVLLFLLFQELLLSSLYRYFLMDTYFVSVQYLPLFVAFFLRWSWEEKRTHLFLSILALGLYIGTASYHSLVGCTLILLVAICSWRQLLNRFARTRKGELSVAALCLILLALPAISTFQESNSLVPIARISYQRPLLESRDTRVASMSYENVVATGANETAAGIVRALFWRSPNSFFPPETANTFGPVVVTALLSIFGLLSICFGFLALTQKWRWITILNLAFLWFFIQRQNTPVHQVICALFPWLTFIRNTIFYTIHLALILLMLAIAGVSTWIRLGHTLIDRFRLQQKSLLRIPNELLVLGIVFLGVLNTNEYTYRPYLGSASFYQPNFFDHKATSFIYPKNRYFFTPRAKTYFLEPLLLQRSAAISMLPVPPEDIAQDYPLVREWLQNNPGGYPYRLGGVRTIFWTPRYHDLFLEYERDPEGLKKALEVGQDFAEVVSADQCALNNLELSCTRADHKKPILPELVFFNLNVFRFKVEVDAAAYLIVRDAHHPHWWAKVNDLQARILEYGNIFKAVRLNPGVNQIEFSFTPKFFLGSLIFQYGVTVLILLFAFFDRRRSA